MVDTRKTKQKKQKNKQTKQKTNKQKKTTSCREQCLLMFAPGFRCKRVYLQEAFDHLRC